jgi:uncharacterized protein (TIGR03437 family)
VPRIVWVALLLTPAGFGYIREATSTATPVPLVQVDNTAIQFFFNSQIVAGYQSPVTGSAVPNITLDSNPQQAARNALATWNTATTANINFLPLKQTSAVINPNDFQATIAFGSTASDLSAVGSALAITAESYTVGPSNQGPNGTFLPCSANCMYPAAGDITDSDIILNPGYTFSTTGTAGSHDLQAVLLHELGHSLSANHTGLLGASMFQAPTNRFLTTDDLAFVNSAYPVPGGGTALGTISGTVMIGGAPVPYALLTAVNSSAGVTVGGVTNPDGTYSFQVPPGNYQLYAEPLNGLLPINIYLNSTQAGLAAATKFQTTLYGGSLNVGANATTTANITVTSGASSLAVPFITVTPMNGVASSLILGGPVTVPSGQPVDLVFAGTAFDGTLSSSNFTFFGQGITVGAVRVDKTESVNEFNLLRVTLNVAATSTPSLASFIVISGSNTLSFSGALVIVPPTPTFVAAGVISSAGYTGIPSGVSPGGIYSIYDIPNTPNLGPANYVASGPYDAYGDLPATLAGVSVTFDGVLAPMFLSWGNQLNFQVPFEVAGKTSTQVVVNYLGSPSVPVAVPVFPVQPTFYESCGGTVCAVNLAADDSYNGVNSAQNPAPAGTYVEVYGTGIGVLSYTFPTGQGAPAPPAGFQSTYTYSIGGSPPAPVAFGGWAYGAVGEAQWNLLIPAGIGTGAVPIVVTNTVTGVSSQPGAMIYVK